jgi:hypothetical protein
VKVLGEQGNMPLAHGGEGWKLIAERLLAKIEGG